ncbi:uncharacterized protein LOC116647109 [Phoca vitulina]|uniref:uncharacterized protein LOC116647109 n=1 Tax=Phoca vitulina TaxID=9720 RepID=UPI00139653E0|nr:uncharacterized protein LOC116647109 [Phoca vitulina]
MYFKILLDPRLLAPLSLRRKKLERPAQGAQSAAAAEAAAAAAPRLRCRQRPPPRQLRGRASPGSALEVVVHCVQPLLTTSQSPHVQREKEKEILDRLFVVESS